MIMFDIKRSFPIAVVIFALSALAKEFIENYINDCQKDMNTIFEKKDDFHALSIWLDKIDEDN